MPLTVTRLCDERMAGFGSARPSHQPACLAYTNQRKTSNHPVGGGIQPLANVPYDQVTQSMEKSAHLCTPQATKSSSDWRNQHACAHLKQPKHPATGEISTLAPTSNNQNIQRLEKSAHLSTSQATKSSTDWRNQYANKLFKRPNHPLAGEISILKKSLKRPKHPATGETQPLTSAANTQIIQPVEKSVRLHASQATKPPTDWRNQHAHQHLRQPKPPMAGEIHSLINLSSGQIIHRLEKTALQ